MPKFGNGHGKVSEMKDFLDFFRFRNGAFLVKTVKIYVNFQNHAISPILIGFSKIKFF